jgi:histidinol phosphatase-like PHP family hydrolase
MVSIMAYQATMPAVDNAKYTMVVHNGQAFRVNTRNGEVDVCDKMLKCVPADKDNTTVAQDK